MKSLGFILIIFLGSLSCKAQTIFPIVDLDTYNEGNNSGKYFKDINNDFAPFLGTWESTTGNITFRLTLYKSTKLPFGFPTEYYMDQIEGNFKLIENTGQPNENIICQSSQNAYPAGILLAGSVDGVEMIGYIYDECATGNQGRPKGGNIKMSIDIGSSPTTAQWTVVRKGISFTGHDFSIPTNAVLTKVN